MKVSEISFFVFNWLKEDRYGGRGSRGVRGRRNPVWQVHTTCSVVGEGEEDIIVHIPCRGGWRP